MPIEMRGAVSTKKLLFVEIVYAKNSKCVDNRKWSSCRLEKRCARVQHLEQTVELAEKLEMRSH